MRKLYVLTGPQAAGKSTWIKENKLEDWTIGTDELRLLYSSHEYQLSEDNKVIDMINISASKVVFETLLNIVEYRLAGGETTFIDFTGLEGRTIKKLKSLSDKYFYEMSIVKFGTDVPTNVLIERDSNRGYRKVGSSVIIRAVDILNEKDFTSLGVNVLTPDEALSSLEYKPVAINYNSVQVIGDVHSSGTALEELMSNFDKNRLYILVGDYFDRGIEHGKTADILFSLLENKNIILLEGNHEGHLQAYCQGNKIRNYGFKTQTLPDLLRSGYNKEKLEKLCRSLKPFYFFNLNGVDMFVSHAGLVPEQVANTNRIGLMPNRYFVLGLGGYERNIDEIWDSNSSLYQFHGHRNIHLRPIITKNEHQTSFNLEQKVEHGGLLASVVISASDIDGDVTIKDVSVVNTVKDPELSKYSEYSEPVSFKSLENDKYVKSKDIGHGIKVFNFSRDAFLDKKWTANTIQARGLFINNANTIVARGYNKFFNLNENIDSNINKVIPKMLNKKVSISNKENGFLGIASYIEEFNKLCVFSKGAGDKFSELAQDTLINELSKNNKSLKDLEDFIKNDFDNGLRYSLTLEVVNPTIDPHIQAYDKPKVFLLDVIENNSKGALLLDKRDEISRLFNLDVPESIEVEFNDFTFSEVETFLSLLGEEKDIEGFVLKFDDGSFVKIKTKWYSSLKYARSIIEKFVYKDFDNEVLIKIINGQIERLDNKEHFGDSEIIKELLESFISKLKSDDLSSLLTKDGKFYIGYLL